MQKTCNISETGQDGTKVTIDKLHRLTERDSRLAHFSAHEILNKKWAFRAFGRYVFGILGIEANVII